ncbi:MAG: hypothetical protein VYA30_04955 [Myxococcota bacterium]|nr:hypothetical protein [Myxococcota bacterium]
MASLKDRLLTDEARGPFVNGCVEVIEAEVGSKSGMGGLVIKTAFKTVKAVKPGIIPDVVNVLIEDFVTQLEPIYMDYRATESGNLRQYLISEADQVADSLLAITDGRAQRSKHRTLVKAYNKLRPQGKKQVVAAMPRIGDLLVSQGLE